MKTLQILAALTLAVALGAACSSQKINHDYDHQTDFSQFKTYQYTKGTPVEDQLMDGRIVSAIETEMGQKGFKKASSNPDVVVTYHASSSQSKQYVTDNFGYGYGPGWGWGGYGGGMGTSTTREITYEKGTLVIDMYDAKKKQLIWRGTGTDTVSDNPQKVVKLIADIVDKIFRNYPPQAS
jgi:hypothetical protein